MKLLIKNGRVVDPANNLDEERDVLVDQGRIVKVGRNLNGGADQIIDAARWLVLPGLIDMHVHLREPGREDKETVESGTRAAVKGGITTLVAMPNTNPAMDTPESVQLLQARIKESAQAHVLIAGCISRSRQGRELTDLARLKRAGIVAISDDGAAVDSAPLLDRALRKAKEQKLAVLLHCEDRNVSAGGVMHLGAMSTRLGLRGISAESEYKRIQRDIQLAEKARCPVHICHVSCAESVEIIARAKKKGVRVTAETAPHYFTLTEEAVRDYDADMKMNPPLRGASDVHAVIQGLIKGTIDTIASDHAPHTINEKEIEFDRAEFGIIGLETELAVAATWLVRPGHLSWSDLVKKLSLHPARILGIDKGTLGPGKAADITIVDPAAEWVVRKEECVSKSRNTPFVGWRLQGRVMYTVVDGKVAYRQ
ncbi:MAG TPA: dihydroorotase [Candidatus Omnitrophota bacterium]|nr:dihydroorotase [Candidatus Omnitrophota bacterium]